MKKHLKTEAIQLKKMGSFILPALSIFISVLVMFPKNGIAQNGWKPLGSAYSIQELKNIIIPRGEWKPYPDVSDSNAFVDIPESVKEAYIRKADKLLHAKWPQLPATTFLEFARNGNRVDYENLSFRRRQMLATLVMAEVFQHKGRFLDQITNGIWAICEESFWGIPAHMFLQKAGPGLPDVQEPVVDLFAAETAQEMAWTYYLLKPELDKVSPLICKRIVYETRKRILKPYLSHNNWDYLGFTWRKHPDKVKQVNNWNPWINSNVIAADLVLAQSPELRLKVLHKTMESIDNFVILYPADGGSDEGPEYWNRAAGALMDYLDLLKNASDGRINRFNEPIVRKMGRYIYKMYISKSWFVNYGDADARISPDPAMLYRFGVATDNATLAHFAAYVAQNQDFGKTNLHYRFGALNRTLFALSIMNHLLKEKPEEPLIRDNWLPDIQVMTARSKSGSTAGFYLMAKAGNNGVSHNHNDIGNYIVYYNGNPVLIDAGAQTYTAQTFSKRRYEIWNNQSAFHNLPTINGVMQQVGKKFTATEVHYFENNREAGLKLDIAKAYPEKAMVQSWGRDIVLHRGKDVEITEKYMLKKCIAPPSENFLTPLQPDVSQPGRIVLTDPANKTKYFIQYNRKEFKASKDIISINDSRMSKIWGHHLYRLILQSNNHALKASFKIRITS